MIAVSIFSSRVLYDMMAWAASEVHLQVPECAHAAAWQKAVAAPIQQHCLCQEDTHTCKTHIVKVVAQDYSLDSRGGTISSSYIVSVCVFILLRLVYDDCLLKCSVSGLVYGANLASSAVIYTSTALQPSAHVA